MHQQASNKNMTADGDELAQAIKRGNAVLFVGAGVSMSVGLPSWHSLVTHMVEELRLPAELLDSADFS